MPDSQPPGAEIVAGLLTAFATYLALAGKVAVIVEIVKKLIVRGILDGKEQYAAFLLGPIFGALAKAYTPFYADVPWGTHMIVCTLMVGSAGAGFIHDTALKALLKIVVPGKVGDEPKPGAGV